MMTNFDDRIRQGMQGDESEPDFEMTKDERLFSLVSDSFRRGKRWLTITGIVKMLVFLAAAVFAGFQFFKSGDVMSLIGWSTAVIICSIVVSMMSITLYMDLQRNAVFRAIKRLEIRLMQAGLLRGNDA